MYLWALTIWGISTTKREIPRINAKLFGVLPSIYFPTK